jgi:hypothetical protein
MVKKSSVSRGRHVGISILAVLAWINSFFTVIFGIAMLVGSAFLSDIIKNFASAEALGWIPVGTAALIFSGIIFILFAVLDFYIARGLWKGQNWARILVIIFISIMALGSIVSLNLVGLIIAAIIIWYLGFYKPAIAWFK